MCSYLCKYSFGHHKDATHASWIESRHLWRKNCLHLTTGLQWFSHSDSVHWVTANLRELVSCVTCSRHVEKPKNTTTTQTTTTPPSLSRLNPDPSIEWCKKRKISMPDRSLRTRQNTPPLRRTTTTKTKILQTHRCLLPTCGYASIACYLTLKFDSAKPTMIIVQAVIYTCYLALVGSDWKPGTGHSFELERVSVCVFINQATAHLKISSEHIISSRSLITSTRNLAT